jgi:hypothetical protein
MHPSSLRNALTAIPLLVIAALAPADGQEQKPAAPPSAPPAQADAAPAAKRLPALSGKERLSEKWTDEQRVDNCKVPPEKRGNTPRPDACPSAPTASR